MPAQIIQLPAWLTAADDTDGCGDKALADAPPGDAQTSADGIEWTARPTFAAIDAGAIVVTLTTASGASSTPLPTMRITLARLNGACGSAETLLQQDIAGWARNETYTLTAVIDEVAFGEGESLSLDITRLDGETPVDLLIGDERSRIAWHSKAGARSIWPGMGFGFGFD